MTGQYTVVPESLSVDAVGGRRGSRSRTRLGVAVVGVVAALFLILLATRESGNDRIGASPLIGKPAPPIVGTTLTGEKYRLADHRGSWVVVNFFASWCVACRQEHPELDAFSKQHAGAGDASVVSVVFDDTESNVRRFFEEMGGDWPVVISGADDAIIEYGVRGVPESFVVSPEGRVVERFIGGVTQKGLNAVIHGARQGSVR